MEHAGFMRFRVWLILVVPAVVAFGAMSCVDSPVPDTSPVKVFIVPSEVDALGAPNIASAPFSLRAYVVDGAGTLTEPAAGSVQWAVAQAGVAITPGTEYPEAAFTAAASAPAEFFVTATVGTVASDPARITRWLAADVRNRIAAPHAAGALPEAAMSVGGTDGSCAWSVSRGVVGLGRADDFDGNPSPPACPAEVAVFTANGQATRTNPVAWNPAGLTVGSSTGASLPDRALRVRYHIWVTHWPADDAPQPGDVLADIQAQGEQFLKQHLLYANDVLRANRLGVHLDFAPATNGMKQVNVAGCDPSPDWPTADGDLHVILVDVISFARGVTCGPLRNDIILISNLWARSDVVAHELGHALGLVAPPDGGHTNTLAPDFAKHNVMWEGDAPARFHLSLGQVYRMNFDPAGFASASFQRTSALAASCPSLAGSVPTAVPACPPLATDFLPRIP